MDYEINVSLNGRHYFATHPRSMRGMTLVNAISMARKFRERFPESDRKSVV